MLDEKFLARLSKAFPEFYATVDEQSRAEAERLRVETHGDVGKALSRARLRGAAQLWWPYVKGSLPVVRPERDAMVGFTRLVLTVGYVLGHEPASMGAARDHVVSVLRQSLDVERLKDMVSRREKEEASAAVAGAGIMASVGAMLAPISLARRGYKFARFIPGWGRIAIAAVVVAAAASVPLVASYSAGRKAEDAARAGTTAVVSVAKTDDLRRVV